MPSRSSVATVMPHDDHAAKASRLSLTDTTRLTVAARRIIRSGCITLDPDVRDEKHDFRAALPQMWLRAWKISRFLPAIDWIELKGDQAGRLAFGSMTNIA
jgi:hypothetical protein